MFCDARAEYARPCVLRVAQVDLPRGRFKLADAKTDAGGREVEISLYLRDELSYDKWIADSQNIYRVETVLSYPGRDDEFGEVLWPGQ